MKQRNGFTSIELLVTLFIAAMALATGYQLYSSIMREDANTRAQAVASQAALTYSKKYSAAVTAPCTPSTPASQQGITIDGVQNPVLTVEITCPSTLPSAVSKITTRITYGNSGQSVYYGTYSSPEGE